MDMLNVSQLGVLVMVMLTLSCSGEKESYPEPIPVPGPEVWLLDQTADKLHIELDNQLLSIQATDVPLIDILEQLAEQTGMQLLSTVPLDEPVNINMEPTPLDLAIDRILNNYNYTLMSYKHPDLKIENSVLTVLAPSQVNNATPMRGLTDADETRRFRAVTRLADLEHNMRGAWFDLAYQDSSYAVRAEVIDTIAASGDSSAIGLVERALVDPSAVVREQAIEALGDIGEPRSIPALARMLEIEDAELREEVVLALASIGGAAAINVIISRLEDSDVDVRETAAEVLEELQEALE